MNLPFKLLACLMMSASVVGCAGELEGDESDSQEAEESADQSGLTVLGSVLTEQALQTHGGNGGVAQLHVVPTSVIDGFQVRRGSEIDGIRFHYYQPTSSTNSVSGNQGWTNWFGGTGGSAPTPFYCPAGKAVIGIKGRAATRLDKIQVICGSANNPNPSDPNNSYSPGDWGGTGGFDFGPELCAPGRLVSSFNLRTGSKIDQIQAICINAH